MVKICFERGIVETRRIVIPTPRNGALTIMTFDGAARYTVSTGGESVGGDHHECMTCRA